MKKKIVIFGTGSISKYLMEHIKDDVEIVAFLTTNAVPENGKKMISLNKLKGISYDYVVIAFGNTPKGRDILKNAGVPEEKIVGYAYSGMTYENSLLQKQCEQFASELLCNEKISELFNLFPKKYYLCGMNIAENSNVIGKDYVREQTLALLASEIYQKSIKGNVAEIGVSAGEFARKINLLFPDRSLYLFDTYEGLPDKDKEHACKLGWGEELYALSEADIQIDDILAQMPYKSNCIIKKGCFPYTFDLKEKLAFVSLDLDFYESTKQGLEMIYPLLSEGGYIMVHDYNNLAFTEVKDAVREFCKEKHVIGVPIPDVGGTIILSK